jgi:hypothetical protein
MGLWDALRQASNYLRKLRLSRGPEGYFRYKLGREHERKEAEHARERAEGVAEHEREKAERERGYEARYAREREGDIALELTERREETGRDPGRDG